MSEKWVLMADEDESLLAFLKRSLENLGPEYRVVIAGNAYAALDQLKQHTFDLVVADYQMTGLGNQRLVEQIQSDQPGLRIIYMAASGVSPQASAAAGLKAYNFITQPVEINAFCQLVRESLGTARINQNLLLVLTEEDYRGLNRVLEKLKSDVGARCVFLADGEGRYIARIGNVGNLPLERIASLLGGSIATLIEAGKTIDGNDNVINLAYREGKSDNLYAVNIGLQYLLIILIGHEPFSSRLGSVWYYAQLAAASLLEKLNNARYTRAGSLLGENLEQAVDGELDKLFGESGAPAAGEKDSAPASSPGSKPQYGNPETMHLLSYDEAVLAGIISDQPKQDDLPDKPERNEKL
jgi:two-component system, NarL family, response regulator DesR